MINPGTIKFGSVKRSTPCKVCGSYIPYKTKAFILRTPNAWATICTTCMLNPLHEFVSLLTDDPEVIDVFVRYSMAHGVDPTQQRK